MVEVAIRLAAPCQLAVPQMLSPANIRYTRALQGLPVTFCNAKRASRIANSPAWGVHVYSSTLWAMGFPLARGSNVTDVTNSICGGVPCLEDHPRYCGILTPAFQPTKRGSAVGFYPKNTPFHRPQNWSTWQWLIIGFTVLPHQLIAPVIHGKTPGLLFLKHPSFSLYLCKEQSSLETKHRKILVILRVHVELLKPGIQNLYLLIISSIPEDFLDVPNDGSSSWSAETWHRHFMS